MKFVLFLLALLPGFSAIATPTNNLIQTDICVFGGTSGGAIAAVAAARLGKSVSLVVVSNHVGGLTAGGLGITDVGNTNTITGLAGEFYGRIGQYYGPGYDQYWFEPHVAEQTFLTMLNGAGVKIYTNQLLAAVTMSNQVITQITIQDGTVYQAKEFIDASYEGDLMAMAGVSFTVGREGTNVYGESLAGIQVPGYTYAYDPYVIAGNPASGLLPFVQSGSPGTPGQGDGKLQTYNFRLCLTQTTTNMLPIPIPTNYSEAQFALFGRYIASRVTNDGSVTLDEIINIQPEIPNGKTDINADGELSTDYIGYNYTYPTNDYVDRQTIYQQHKDYTTGLLHYLAVSTNVPQNVRTAMQSWGLAKDEFQDNGGWPYPMYVREARRMVSDYVMQQSDVYGTRAAADPIALGSYALDSHPVARLAVNGLCMEEGSIGVGVTTPFGISYRSIIPKVGQCQNLFSTFALSASHIGFASIRLEAPFMMLSQAAATAASFAIDDQVPVQSVNYQKLAAELTADGQMIVWNPGGQSVSSNGIILYQGSASGVTIVGAWSTGANPGGWQGSYFLDEATGKGSKYVQYVPVLPTNAVYDIYLWWVAANNRATNVPVDIVSPSGTKRVYINQQLNGSQWVKVLTTNLTAGSSSSVTIRNVGTTSGLYVVANGVRWVPEGITLNGTTNPPPNIAIIASDSIAGEFNTNTARFSIVSLTGTNPMPVTINYSISGTASNGVDYVAIPSSVTLQTGAVATNIIITPLGDTLPANAETVTLTLLPSTNYTFTNFSIATVTLNDRPVDVWYRANFTANQLVNPLIGGDSAIPGNDGLPNLVKYALGLSPFTSYTNIFQPSVTNGYFTLAYTEAATDVALTFDYSTNLVNWNSGTNYLQTNSLITQGLLQYFKLQTIAPVSSNATGFVRFHAIRL